MSLNYEGSKPEGKNAVRSVWLTMLLLLAGTAACRAQTSANKTIQVYFLQQSQLPDVTSFMKWSGRFPSTLTAMSICYRIKVHFFRSEVTVFSLMDADGRDMRTDHNRRGMQVLLSQYNLRISTTIVTPLLFWSAFCVVVDATAGRIAIFFNGDLEHEEKFLANTPVLSPKGGTVVLGQDQDVPGGLYDSSQSFCGEITDVQVYSYVLRDEELKNITLCTSSIDQKATRGDVIDWDSAQWTLGEDYKEVPVRETCQVSPTQHVMFQELLQFNAAVNLCSAFGGRLSLPSNDQELKEVYKIANQSAAACAPSNGPLTWLDMTDRSYEGEWRRASDNSKVTYFNWRFGQPNGDYIENCAVMREEGAWSDISCAKSFQVCAMCELNVPVNLRFRGICDASLYDDLFVMDGLRNFKPYFRGYYRSEIYYDKRLGAWRLQNIESANTYAVMEQSKSVNYPIGRNNWKFNHGFCGIALGYDVSLTLTQCKKNKEFTCDDGSCLPLEQVCDRRVQCPDNSDEMDCNLAIVPKGYKHSLPPPSLVGDGENFDPVDVYLNISLRSFYAIESVENRFNVELTLRIIWKDPRLKFKCLKVDRQLNIMQPEEVSRKIWVPEISFQDSENNLNSVVDSKTKITIARLGDPEEDNIQWSREGHIFDGNATYIRMVRVYNIWFRCNFDFFYFPFNTDYCTMSFQANKYTKTYVNLKKYGPGIIYENKDQLPKYSITGIAFREDESSEMYSKLIATVKMEHLFANEMVTIFVPTALINMIGFATFFYKWFDFQNRTMISLTSLLVLSTFFSQVSDTLPATSYLKLVDFWFLVSIIYCFTIIMTHVVIEYFHDYSNPTDSSVKNGFPSSIENIDAQNIEVRSDRIAKIVNNYVEDLSLGLTKGISDDSIKDPKWKRVQDPYATPKKIDKWAFRVTVTTYVIFLIVFWTMPLTDKLTERFNVMVNEYDPIIGYP
ncbi:Pentraxin-related [Trinorchestia longiramus]|nr:Pentraxin-related [Trinorchestia longiramus]